MQNPIPRSGLFASPTLGELDEMIRQLPIKEQSSAYLYVMMALNACHNLVQEAIAAETTTV